ncbi:MAG TPA: hypothetical protein VK029_02635 [Pseudogracilibacillus sp.]|nr:hypothetical protein [Pseudogracilibacillus sp.]
MNEEIKRILQMVEAGKLSSDEGSQLIAALDERKTNSSHATSASGKMLRVRIQDGDAERVNVNIPIQLVQFLLKMGHGIASHIPEAKPYVEQIEVETILDAIDRGIDGKIVDIQSDEGEVVEVFIE